ncbi:MAG: DUF4835 family protein [Bacteroidales bacterium]|nr:DUF4835 family protein [Bacteroidales bacterium]
MNNKSTFIALSTERIIIFVELNERMKKGLLLIIVCLALCCNAFSQELRCHVNIQYNDIANADKDLFNTLRSSIEDFMNSQTWTTHSFEEQEKIEVKLTLRITSQSSKNFAGTLQVQSSRPVYNSTYTTTLFNHVDDKISFQYEENEPIEFSENAFMSNLSSVLAYYAYIVIGLDYDSFSQNGGMEFFQKAQNVVTMAQANDESGWSSSSRDDKTRYWFIENLLNSSYSAFHTAMYKYHRLGLDIMYDKPEEGRKAVYNGVQELEKVFKQKPGSYLLTAFFYAKKDEIVQMYSEGNPDEKNRMTTLAKKLNPANVNDYDKINSTK